MTTLFAVIGMLLIIASVGFIETDQWIANIISTFGCFINDTNLSVSRME